MDDESVDREEILFYINNQMSLDFWSIRNRNTAICYFKATKNKEMIHLALDVWREMHNIDEISFEQMVPASYIAGQHGKALIHFYNGENFVRMKLLNG